MPRAAVRVQAARDQTQWTLRDHHQQHYDHADLPPAYSPVDMQNHGHYYGDDHDPSLPSYEGYDGSGYGSPGSSSRTSSVQYAQYNNTMKQPPTQVNGHYGDFDFRQSYHDQQRALDPSQALANGGHFNDFKFHPSADDQVASHHISLNTNLRQHNQDAVGRHLLYETALLDTQSYEILDINEVDELKKEHARLNQRLEAANRKLQLESKLKDAAQNLQRLYSSGKKDARPDTPQSPESPRNKGRSSLLGSRGRTSSGAQSLHQAEDELAQSIKKVDEVNEQIKTLMERRQTVEGRLLRHTAAVLAEQASQTPELRTDVASNHQAYDRDELHLPGPDEFDGIRDILRGSPAPSSKRDLEKVKGEHEQQLVQMQGRLEHLNSQLRGVITEASQSRSRSPPPEPSLTQSENPRERLDSTVSIIESNMRALEQERAQGTTSDVEDQLEALNSQLHRTLQSSESTQHLQSLSEPPQANGQGYQSQLQYLEQSLATMEKILKHHSDELQDAKQASREVEEAMSKGETHAKKAAEYETVLAGLWEILSAEPSGHTPRGSIDDSSRNSRGDRSPVGPLKEDFSLQAFSSRVQHLYDVATGAREQQDILRRQIQQQRDLNGKSDMEKDAQVGEIQAQYDKLQVSYDATQQELAKAMAGHEEASREATETRNEMANVMNELEQFKRTVDETQARQKEVDASHAEVQKQLEQQESEVVRLMTELTIARADLEAAHGTRSERQKEAGMQAEEIEDLKKTHDQQLETLRREQAEKAKLLEQELQDMTNEFQEMTRESLELEKERGQLDGLIDGLRDRCDQLEAQLNDERIKWMGIKSPGDQGGGPRETTSVMVLRQEFKKMMREARAEGVRLLRAEQEERRKLESDLRKLRQDNGPMGRHIRLHAPGSSIGSSHHGRSMTNGDTLSPLSAATPQPHQQQFSSAAAATPVAG